MKKTWLIVAALLVALLAVEQGLERTKEKKEEDRAVRIGDIRATRLLPQYIASLFMGSFRAIAVDALWVQLGRMREEEHRYFEAVELMDMIATLQPNNPEVWAYQGWDMAYSIANHVSDRETRWRWIRKGLLKLRDGTIQLPEDPYLKTQVGSTLMEKATRWKEGYFEGDYTSRVEADRELQDLLSLGGKAGRPLTVFELAIPWYQAALRDLETMKREQRWRYLWITSKAEEDRDYHTTQSGLNVHPSSIDGSIYRAKFYNAFYCRKQNRLDEAARWFREAAEQARYYRKHYEWSSPIFDDYAALCDGMAEVCGMPATTPSERLRMMDKMIQIQKATKAVDYSYLSVELSDLKRELGGDDYEYNDDIEHAESVAPEKEVGATIAPAGDIDVFQGYVRQPEEASEHAFAPQRVSFMVKKDGDLDLKATLWTFKGGRLQPAGEPVPLREDGWVQVEGITDHAGQFMIFVEALDPAAQAQKPAYSLKWSVAEPVR